MSPSLSEIKKDKVLSTREKTIDRALVLLVMTCNDDESRCHTGVAPTPVHAMATPKVLLYFDLSLHFYTPSPTTITISMSIVHIHGTRIKEHSKGVPSDVYHSTFFVSCTV